MKRFIVLLVAILSLSGLATTAANAAPNTLPPARCHLMGKFPHGHTWITVQITRNPCTIHWGARIQCKYFPTHGPTATKVAYGPVRFHLGKSHVSCPANGEPVSAIWEGFRYFWPKNSHGVWHIVKLA